MAERSAARTLALWLYRAVAAAAIVHFVFVSAVDLDGSAAAVVLFVVAAAVVLPPLRSQLPAWMRISSFLLLLLGANLLALRDARIDLAGS